MTATHLTTFLPWLLSAITIVSTVLTGNKHRLAWLISLAGQAGWLAFIIASGSWGFLPLTATLTFLYLRNHMKWREEERLSAIEREHFGDPDKGTGIYAKASINWHADENPWKMAVTAAMICAHILRREHETDPEKALAELLAWEIDVALDPAVSSRAEALVQRGRDETKPYMADAYAGAREDLQDWKRRAQAAEALLSFKPGLPETTDVDEAIRLSRMDVVQEAERDDYHLWALRILAAEVIAMRDEEQSVPQPGDPLYLMSQAKSLPAVSGPVVMRFRRYLLPAPATPEGGLADLQRNESASAEAAR
ncbi:hypothetical protein [Variovorax sp. 278MFTsu5.1]|uniref:hypothetical protein n=1 Tax=Variovorax sp. 278MFTsu5.1 TaxID=3158366 RepID=UPI003AAF564B